jgi:hypothetical protein
VLLQDFKGMSREISQGSNVTLFDRVSLKDVPLEFFSNLIQPYVKKNH